MRAAAFTAATLIAVSLYLILAATVGLSTVWIAAGSVAIALIASIAFVARTGVEATA